MHSIKDVVGKNYFSAVGCLTCKEKKENTSKCKYIQKFYYVIVSCVKPWFVHPKIVFKIIISRWAFKLQYSFDHCTQWCFGSYADIGNSNYIKVILSKNLTFITIIYSLMNMRQLHILFNSTKTCLLISVFSPKFTWAEQFGENTEINKQLHVKFWLNWIKYGAVSNSLSCNRFCFFTWRNLVGICPHVPICFLALFIQFVR